eukprot:4503089-Amphidinium_carterae.1
MGIARRSLDEYDLHCVASEALRNIAREAKAPPNSKQNLCTLNCQHIFAPKCTTKRLSEQAFKRLAMRVSS